MFISVLCKIRQCWGSVVAQKLSGIWALSLLLKLILNNEFLPQGPRKNSLALATILHFSREDRSKEQHNLLLFLEFVYLIFTYFLHLLPEPSHITLLFARKIG